MIPSSSLVWLLLLLSITVIVFSAAPAAAAGPHRPPTRTTTSSHHHRRAPPPPLVSYEAEIGKEDIFRSIVTQEECNKAHVIVDSSSSKEEEMFHEAGIWMPRTKEWIVTSNRLNKSSAKSSKANEGEPHVDILAINHKTKSVRHLPHLSSSILMGNGGTADGKGGAYICSQGLGEISGAIYHTECCNANEKGATLILGGGSAGADGKVQQQFNSPNDICLFQDKWLLFTDPTYGYEQGFRYGGKPNGYGNCVWCASTDGKIVFPLITCDELKKPNGVCLSPDQSVLYVTDTAYATGRTNPTNGHGEIDPTLPRHVLAYDITTTRTMDDARPPLNNNDMMMMIPKVSNRRIVFEFCCNHGVPDGIKVDVDGNIYVGAGDGLRIYSAKTGKLIGKLTIEGGVANLCFGGDDLRDLLLLNEKRAIIIRMEKPGINLQPNYYSC